MVALTVHQEDTYRRGIARCGGDRDRALRVVLCFYTESKGNQLRNDGLAYHPDARLRRKGWADGWSAAQCQPIYDALRKSLLYPSYGREPGNNGGSTGAAQGLSDDYLTARFGRPTSYGWGSIAQQLNPETGIDFVADAFLRKLVVTDDRVYRYTVNGENRKVTCSDAAVADVLRVQQPLPSEAESSNYGAANLAAARTILDQLWGSEVIPSTPTSGSWIDQLLGRI